MDDPNMTMEEYIKFEEEKARRRGRVFNWQTATYGKVRVDDDLYDLRSVEAEFPAIVRVFNDFGGTISSIVYNDAQTSKSDLLTEPILNPQHIDKFNLNDETSMSEYDEEEQNILYFNDLFPFNIIRFNDLKSEKDNDIDIMQSFEDMALPPREQRHQFLRVPVFDFGGSPNLMAEGLSARMLMEHQEDKEVSLFTSRACRRLFVIRGSLVHELILEFYNTFRFGQAILDLGTLGALQFRLGGARRCMSWKEFILALGLHTDEEMQTARFAPSYTMIRDPILRLCHRLSACSIAGRSQAPKKSEAHISRGQFVARLAAHFGLLTAEILGGLMVISLSFLLLIWLSCCSPAVAEDAPVVDEGGQAVPTPMQAPQQPLPPPFAARTIPQRWGRLEEEVQGLRRDVRSLPGLMEKLITDQGRFSTWMILCMAQLMEASGQTYQAFDGTFQGSSPGTFHRRTRQRTSE
ncbi:hypothetical protein Tco_0290536 [Tanacetum coccineum]